MIDTHIAAVVPQPCKKCGNRHVELADIIADGGDVLSCVRSRVIAYARAMQKARGTAA